MSTTVYADSDDDRPATQPTETAVQPSPNALTVDPTAAQQMGIRVAPVTRQRLAIALKLTGQITALPNQQAAVTAPIMGTVVHLLAKPNDAVQAGQVVALLSSPELAQLRVEAIQKRAEAEAELQQAQADLKLAQQNYGRQQQQAIADLKEAQAQVALSQERRDRNRELETAGAITRRQLQESDAELAASRATLTKAQSKLGELDAANQLSRAVAAVAVAQSHVRLSDAAYRARLQQLGTTANPEGLVKVTAPIAGIVADRPVTVGETVTVEAASKPLMTIVNAQKVWATANVHEADVAQVKVGQAAQVTVASLPDRSFTGRVAQIGTVVEATKRVVPVNVELDNDTGLLKPGAFAKLEIFTHSTPVAVLAIPKTAIVDTNGTTTVFVQQGNAYHAVPVTLGAAAGQWVEVKTGLQDDDRVVTAGATLLYAQSLGGGGIPTDDDDKPATTSPSDHDLDDILRDLKMPVWVGFPLGGAIAAGAFWLGRRTRRLTAKLQTTPPAPVLPSEASNTSNPETPDPVPPPDAAIDPAPHASHSPQEN